MLHSSKFALFVVAVTLSVATWTSVGFAQGRHEPGLRPPEVPYLHIPPQVRLTGTLHPVEEKGAPVQAVKIFVQNKEWNFWLTQVDVLTGTNYGWLTLAELFPRELRLSGPEKLLGPLEKSEIVDKPVIVEGRLYSSDRKLVVTTVEEPATISAVQ
ncbi:MAG: hypothetical protein AB7G75_18395 [Candidatus Binatia bacterium]